LPSYGDLGFLNTYKENKFYWGISFDTFGKIKSIDQTKYKLSFKSGKLQKGRRIGDFDNDSNYYIKFDEQGRIIETIDYPKYSNYRTYSYNYDEFDNLIEVKGYNPNGDCVSAEKYTYNEFGGLFQEEFFQINTYKKYTHNYDENYNDIETFYTELHGYPLISFVMDYFVLGEANREEDVYLKSYKSYNENGSLVKEITHKSNINENIGNVIETYICDYDSNGNLLKELKKTDIIGEAKSTIELNHFYDKTGIKNSTKLRFDFGGLKININTIIVRDINGFVKEIIENQKTIGGKIKYSEKFEYDKYNNVSRIYFFKNDKPKFLIERKIEYY
jgi:hypothetical protein